MQLKDYVLPSLANLSETTCKSGLWPWTGAAQIHNIASVPCRRLGTVYDQTTVPPSAHVLSEMARLGTVQMAVVKL